MLQLRKQLLLRCLELAHNWQRPQLTDPSTNISNRQAWLWCLLALLMLMLLLLKAVVSLKQMETLQASDNPPMQVIKWLKPISVGCLVLRCHGSVAAQRKGKENTAPSVINVMKCQVLYQAAQVWQCSVRVSIILM